MTINLDLTKPVNNLSNPLFEKVGNTLGAIWDLTFGRIDHIAEKNNLKWAKHLEAFKASLEQKVSEIPTEKFCEPRLSIIGPALEASRYYFEDNTLRDMFANLIANSMNLNYQKYIQNSFVEAIKQMTPLDALLLKEFVSSSGSYEDLPLLQIATMNSSRLPGNEDMFCSQISAEYQVMKSYYYSNMSVPSFTEENISILFDNLLRLGLIVIPENVHIFDLTEYDRYKSDPYINSLISEYDDSSDKLIRFIYLAASLTDYGEYFCKVCL